MADLDQPRPLTLADVGDAGAQQLEVRTRLLPGLGRARYDDRQTAGRGDLRVAADRSREDRRAAPLARDANRGGGRGEIVEVRSTILQRRGARVGVREQPLVAEDHLLEVVRAGDHREDEVAVGELRRIVDDRRAELGERFSLGPRAVVDGHVVAGLEQPRGQREPHPAGADPAEAKWLLVVHAGSWGSFMRFGERSCKRLQDPTVWTGGGQAKPQLAETKTPRRAARDIGRRRRAANPAARPRIRRPLACGAISRGRRSG